MRKLLQFKFFIIVTIGLCSSVAWANQLGLGFMLFGPTGVSANYRLAPDRSLDAALAWSLNDGDQNFYLHADHLWRNLRPLRLEQVVFKPYWGLGGRLISWNTESDKKDKDRSELGLRASLGSSYDFPRTALEAFGEAALVMSLIPSTAVDFSLGLGLRYYF